MTDCDDDKVERRTPDLGDSGGLVTPDVESMRLVTSPTDDFPLTARAEVDAHGAIVGGLAAYVAGLETAIGGRLIAMSRVVTDWAEHDDGATHAPSCVVYSNEIGKYETDSWMTGGDATKLGPDGQGRFLALSSNGTYRLEELQVEVRCEDKIQRRAVRRMLEDGCNPVQWMSGFRLVLPRYHGSTASYSMTAAQQMDSSELATAGIWPLVIRLTAWCSVYRLHHLPLARPIVRGTIRVGPRRT